MAVSKNATIGAKIELDGTQEYNNNIKSITNAMKRLESESKLLSSEYKENENSGEALRKKQQLLTEMFEKQQQKVEEYSKALKTSQENLDRCGQNVANWKEKLQQAQKALEEMKDSQNASNDEITKQESTVEKLTRGLETAEKQYRQVDNAVNKWGTQLNNAQVDLNDLTQDLSDNTRYLNEAEQSTDDCATSIDEFGNKVTEAEEKTSTFGDVLKASLVGDAITSAIDGITDKIRDFVGTVMDTSNSTVESMNKIQAATGMTAEETERYGDVMEEVFTDNFGESLDEIGEALTRVRQQLGDMDSDSLKNVTEDAFLLRDTFDFDIDESLRSAKMLMDQFGLTAEEAYTLIAQGAQNGLDKNDDLLDTINEYSVQYKNAGLSAEEMFNMLENGCEAGVFSVDKMADAFKEFTIRLQDGTSDQALKNIGLNADLVKAKFEQGGDAAKSAMQDIMGGLDGLTDKSERYVAMQTMFGTMFEDVGESGVRALLDVSGQADATADTLQKMNDVRYNDLNSTLEGLGRNVLTRVAEPFSQATETMSGSVQSISDKVKNGGLGNALESLGESVAGLITGFVNFASVAAPPLISVLTWLIDNAPIVAGGIVAITTAMNYDSILKFGSSILAMIGNLKALVAIAVESGSVMGALNAVLALTPTGVLIAGIAGVVTALGLWATSSSKVSDKQAKLNKEVQDITASVNNNRKAMDESRKTYETSTQKLETQAKTAHDLADKLYKLDSAKNKTNKTVQQEQTLINKLNALYPQLGLKYDQNTGKINKNKQAVDKLIDARKKEALASVQNERYTKIMDQQVQATMDQQNALKKLEDTFGATGDKAVEMARKYKAATNKNVFDTAGLKIADKVMQALGQDCGLTGEQVAEMVDAYDKATNELKENETESKKLDSAIKKLNGTEENETDATNKNADSKDKLSGAIDKAGVAVTSYGDATDFAKEKDYLLMDTESELQDAISENEQQIRDEYEQTKATLENSINNSIDYFSKFADDCEMSTQDIITAFESNREGVENWHQDLNTIAESTSTDFVQYLAQLGPDAAGEIHTMAGMSSDELKGVEQAWSDTQNEVSKTVDDTYNDVDDKIAERTSELKNIFKDNIDRESFYDSGYDAGARGGDGVVAGLNSKASDVAAAAGNLAERAAEAQRAALMINSPSRVMMEIGKYAGEGLALGLDSTQSTVEHASTRLTGKITQGINLTKAKIGTQVTYKQDYTGISRDIGTEITKALQKGKFIVDRDGVMRFMDAVARRRFV